MSSSYDSSYSSSNLQPISPLLSNQHSRNLSTDSSTEESSDLDIGGNSHVNLHTCEWNVNDVDFDALEGHSNQSSGSSNSDSEMSLLRAGRTSIEARSRRSRAPPPSPSSYSDSHSSTSDSVINIDSSSNEDDHRSDLSVASNSSVHVSAGSGTEAETNSNDVILGLPQHQGLSFADVFPVFPTPSGLLDMNLPEDGDSLEFGNLLDQVLNYDLVLRRRNQTQPPETVGSFIEAFQQEADDRERINSGSNGSTHSSSLSSLEEEAMMASTNNTRSSAAGTSEASSISFECSVCLERLDAPASIDDGREKQQNGEQNEQHQVNGTYGAPRGGTNSDIPQRGGACLRGNRRPQNQNVSTTDVVATHCGHLYHKMCLERWFKEQGKRTCPSCRKTVPKSMLIRLYPNSSVEAGYNYKNFNAKDLNLPGPSNGNSIAVGSSSTGPAVTESSLSSTVSVEQQAEVVGAGEECMKAECQDLKIIHNTLINDFNELQSRFNNIRENEDMKDAQLQSLEIENAIQMNEILRLKSFTEEVVPLSDTSTNKRRRQ